MVRVAHLDRAAHAYGTSQEVPYSEQFYIGGANFIRAFNCSLDRPGSYRAPVSMRDGYFDQTGTFKLELNTQSIVSSIISVLHGAVFVDAEISGCSRMTSMRPGVCTQWENILKDIALGTESACM